MARLRGVFCLGGRYPLYEDKIVSYKGKVKHVPVAKMRAMTLDGLYTFIDLDPTTWRKYRTRSKAYAQITSAVERIIRDQKFAGAAADLLNANIIAHDLGLADKSQIGGDPDSPIIHKIERRIVRPGDTNS